MSHDPYAFDSDETHLDGFAVAAEEEELTALAAGEDDEDEDADEGEEIEGDEDEDDEDSDDDDSDSDDSDEGDEDEDDEGDEDDSDDDSDEGDEDDSDEDDSDEDDSDDDDSDEEKKPARRKRSRRKRGGRGSRGSRGSRGDSGDDDSEEDDDGELPEGVHAWWGAWGKLRGYLVSATDRGQPHPDMGPTAASLTAKGASLEALATWVPTADERSQLERSRRTVNSACDTNVEEDKALERVREDLAGEGDRWAQLLALAEAWVLARRAGLEPPRRNRRKGRSRRGREKEAKEEPAKTEAKAEKPADDGGRRKGRRRKGRRRKEASVPQGKWAAYPVRSWASDADELAIWAWFAPATDDAAATVAGVVQGSWGVDSDALSPADVVDPADAEQHEDIWKALATLEQSDASLPFRVPVTGDDPVAATADALRLLVQWLLAERAEGTSTALQVHLGHEGGILEPAPAAAEAASESEDDAGEDADADGAGADGEGDAAEAEAPEAPKPELTDVTEAFAALATEDGPFRVEVARLVRVVSGDAEQLDDEATALQGYLGYARMLAATRPGAALQADADKHLGSPHFECALPAGTELLAGLDAVAALDTTAATDELLDLLPLVGGTPLADRVVATARERVGENAGLQLKLLLGIDSRAKESDRDVEALRRLVSDVRPLLADLPAATPARVRALALLGEVRDSRRHEQLTELAGTWTEHRDAIAEADPELADAVLDLLVERLNSRVDYVTARDLLAYACAEERFASLDVTRRASLLLDLATADSAAGQRLRADARFGEALELLDAEEHAELRREALRRRALNALDARLHADADSEADVPSTDAPVEEAEDDSEDEGDAEGEGDAEDDSDEGEDEGEGEDDSDDNDDSDEDDDDSDEDDDDDSDEEDDDSDEEDEDDSDEDDDDSDEDDDDSDDDDSDEEDGDSDEDEEDEEDDEEDEEDDDDDDDDVLPPRAAGAREALGATADALVLEVLGVEALSDAIADLAGDRGERDREHLLLLHYLWANEDQSELEDAYLSAAKVGDAHPNPEVDLYRALLLFLAGKDRDAGRCIQNAARTGRSDKSTAARLLVATIQVVGACIADGRNGRVRSALRQLRERLPSTATHAVDTLAAIQARPDEDKIDLALAVLPLTLR